MTNEEKLMKRPGEWAEEAGLELVNYDGFVRVYEKLKDIKLEYAGEFVMAKAHSAGQILCTREGFDAAVGDCTMKFYRDMDWEKVSEVAPNFSERHVLASAYNKVFLMKGEDSDELQKTLQELLKEISSFKSIRANNIRINDVKEEKDLSELHEWVARGSEPSDKVIKKAQRKGGTVEALEEKLLEKITKDLEKMVKKGQTDISKVPGSYIKALCLLNNETVRHDKYMAVNLLKECNLDIEREEDKEMVIQPYNIIGNDEVHSRAVGQMGGITIDMETTPEQNERIKKNMKKATENKKKNSNRPGQLMEKTAKAVLEMNIDEQDIIDVSIAQQEQDIHEIEGEDNIDIDE